MGGITPGTSEVPGWERTARLRASEGRLLRAARSFSANVSQPCLSPGLGAVGARGKAEPISGLFQIRNILKQGIETPEDQNDLRKMQLRELARLNGTLREDDNR